MSSLFTLSTVSESTVHLFPSTTLKEVEVLISKYLKGVNDRFGGRTERRHKAKQDSGPLPKCRRRLFDSDDDE